MIPFFDLRQQNQEIRAELEAAIAGVLERGNFILGEEVEAFEEEFSEYCGVSQVVGVACGTEALQIALQALEIGPGGEVITVSHTAVASVAAIELARAKPVLVDIDPKRYTLDPGKLKAAITPRTRAIMPVHLYGCPADLEAILKIAEVQGLWVIEHCAQAHGAHYQGKSVGYWGHAGAFSFYPTKNLGAYGDGGAIATNDPALAERARMLRQHGWKERYVSQLKGLNSCLDELQAAILRVKLRHLERWNERRRKLAGLYAEMLAGQGVTTPWQPPDSAHVFHQYVVRHSQRNDLGAYLKSQGIETLVHYPTPVHLQPAYEGLGYMKGNLPESERAAGEVLSLPMYPELSEEEVERVCAAVGEFGRGIRR